MVRRIEPLLRPGRLGAWRRGRLWRMTGVEASDHTVRRVAVSAPARSWTVRPGHRDPGVDREGCRRSPGKALDEA